MIKYIILVFTSLATLNIGYAQENIDSLFSIAISHAQNKEYQKAIQITEYALQKDSSRTDILLYKANIYAWQGDYDKAKHLIHSIHEIRPIYRELYDTWLNVLLWNKEYKELLKTTTIAEQHGYPDQYNIILKKALVFKELGNYNQGINIIEESPNLLDSIKIRTIYNQLTSLNQRKHIMAYYSIDVFENNIPTPHHLAYLEYGNKINNNTLIFRANYTYRFELNDLMPEADYYHIFNNNHYLYSNYGFSIQNTLFPNHRIGIEYYFPLGNGFEASFGGRLLSFTNNNIPILTGHIGKYESTIWIGVRPYYAITKNGNSLTLVGNIRKFSSNPINYWGVELTYGNSPDERKTSSTLDKTVGLNTYKIKLERNFSITNSSELKITIGFAQEEFVENRYRDRYSTEVMFKQRF